MPKQATDEAVVQVATRVPRELLQRIRVYCVRHEQSMMDFVAEAFREKLRRVVARLVPLAMSVVELLAA